MEKLEVMEWHLPLDTCDQCEQRVGCVVVVAFKRDGVLRKNSRLCASCAQQLRDKLTSILNRL